MAIKFTKNSKKVTCNEFKEDSSGLTSFLPFEKDGSTYRVHVKELVESNDASSISYNRSSSTLTCKAIEEVNN